VETLVAITLMAVVLFFGGVQLLTLGIMGAYIGRTYTETQDRPLYLVREVVQGQGELRSGGCHEQSVLPSDVSDLATG
jgi:predicted exporter